MSILSSGVPVIGKFSDGLVGVVDTHYIKGRNGEYLQLDKTALGYNGSVVNLHMIVADPYGNVVYDGDNTTILLNATGDYRIDLVHNL